MYIVTFGARHAGAQPDTQHIERQIAALTLRDASFVIAYGDADLPVESVASLLARRYPRVPMFGATSGRGVFLPNGLFRGIALLVGESKDDITVELALQTVGAAHASQAAESGCRQIQRALGRMPNALILHATPGFEEQILAGARNVFGTTVPVYGGSAADDGATGRWRVFAGGSVCREGFVLAGLVAPRPIFGGFTGGYLPTGHGGTVTRAEDRIVYEIDGTPAAVVYNQWTQGLISKELERGGSVSAKTTLFPIGRAVGKNVGLPQRLTSHPQRVLPDSGALQFLSHFSIGDAITLMASTPDPLVTRVHRMVQRAGTAQAMPPRGGILMYSGDCLSAVQERAPLIPKEFQRAVGDIPFIGLASMGEQGCFFDKSESYHANLMCSALLF